MFEAGTPVVWTKPQDTTLDAKKALPKFGGPFDGAFNAVVGDGSVFALTTTGRANDPAVWSIHREHTSPGSSRRRKPRPVSPRANAPWSERRVVGR